MKISAKAINWSSYSFASVIKLPDDYEVYDFTKGYDPNRELKSPYGIGRFNEVRPSMYTSELYENERNIHMGIDIGAPIGTLVHAFYPGEVVYTAYNAAPLDYGNTLVTRHVVGGQTIYALFGHLAPLEKKVGVRFESGDVIAKVGDKSENGGWNPHLHLQLSLSDPGKADMPGVVTRADLDKSLDLYIDPREVLGPLY